MNNTDNLLAIGLLFIGALVVILTTLFVVGYHTKRFFFRVKTGFVCAIGAGDALQYYLLHEKDYASMIRIIEAQTKEAHELPTTDEFVAIKANILKNVATWTELLRTQVKKTGWLTELTGFWFTINPFVTMIKSDRGNGPVYVSILNSPDLTIDGVEIAGSNVKSDSGAITTVTIKVELQGGFWIDFRRIFFEETSTTKQIEGRVEAAARLLCSDRNMSDIVAQDFSPIGEARVMQDLIEFGLLLVGPLSVYDCEISGGAKETMDATVEAELKAKLLVQQQKNAKTEADTAALRIETIAAADAKAKALMLKAENDGFLERGEFEAQILEATMKAAGNNPDIVRAAIAEDPAGALPTKVLAVHLGESNRDKKNKQS